MSSMPVVRMRGRPLDAYVAVLTGLIFSVTAGRGAHPPGGEEALDHRSAPVIPVGSGRTGFTLLPPHQTGLAFTNLVPERLHLTNQILLNGSGVAAGDVDGDGWCDLYFCRLAGSNRLYRNLGNWRFAEVTQTAGVACSDLASSGAAFADLDGDGDLDLIVNSVGQGTHLLINDGQGRFRRSPEPLNGRKAGMTIAVADVDGNGWLDFYVSNYRTSALMDVPNARATFRTLDGKTVVDTFNGRPTTDPDLAGRFVVGPRGTIEEQGEPDELYLNQGGGRFTAASFTDGRFQDEEGVPLVKPLTDWGLSAMFRDINGDRLPDLYVCNDFQTEDRFWLNQGQGRFRLQPRLAQRKSSLFSMAVDFADVNRDGADDFLVLDMMSRQHRSRMIYMGDTDPSPPVIGKFDDRPQYGFNTLQVNRGDGTFAESAQFAGLEASEWSWSCIFLDVDLDGWEDLVVSSGMERAARDLDVAQRLKEMRAAKRMSDEEIFLARRMFPRLDTGHLAFRNRGDLTFEEVSQAWGFGQEVVAQSMAVADLDNDGDLDLAVNNFNAAAGIYRNDSPAPRVAVRLEGRPPNTRGVGARITVTAPGLPTQTQEMICGGRYLASDDGVRTFAAGDITQRLDIEVAWPSGTRTRLQNVAANRRYVIIEPEAADGPGPAPATAIEPPPGLFEDVSQRLGHVHPEAPFDDFARQPLLPKKLSQLGPGVAWLDLDGDGWEDLFIGAGNGGVTGAYRNGGDGNFDSFEDATLGIPTSDDQTGIVGWSAGADAAFLVVGTANYEGGGGDAGAAWLRRWPTNALESNLPASRSSTGPLALADVDGDGDLDLFVGGRVLPGHYPASASSRLFRREGEQFVQDQENAAVFDGVGLVSGAVFSDLDADGDPDLALACEWGPIRLFRNAKGRYAAWAPAVELPTGAGTRAPGTSSPSRRLTMDDLTGWWNSVAAGDFDGDGRLDLVAGNWGRNTRYEAHRARPLEVHHGDFDGDGLWDVVEAHWEPSLGKSVPDRQLGVLARALPFLRERFTSNRSFSRAGISEVLGERAKQGSVVQASWLESSVFLNRGERFEARVLPAEAQLAPAFGACVGDANGDGHEDLFLAQNFFAVELETARYDAGRGLWLLGDGQGDFRALPGQSSGVRVYGEQRGAAVADYDADGRLDLVVTQNGAATRLFRNTGARPGLRVQLRGSRYNPQVIGAALRLDFPSGPGPVREVRAGSGYWSQDGAIQVLGTPEAPVRLTVRWPGGQAVTYTLPSGAREVAVDREGGLTVLR